MKSDQRSAKTGRDDAVTGPATRPRGAAGRAPADDPETGEGTPYDRAVTHELDPPPGAASRRRRGRRRRPPPPTGRPRNRDRERPPAPSQVPFFVGGITAVAFVLLSLADGGFAAGTWAEATILVWWTALVAVLANAWPRSPIPPAASVAGLALLGLAVLSGASMDWASDLGAAYADAIRALGYLGVFVLAAIACRAGAATPLLAGTAVGLFIVACLALLSRLEPGFTGGPDEFLALDISGGRLSYPLGYWNALGACMASALVLFVWLGSGARTRGLRALGVAAIPVAVLTLFFSGSRGGVIAAAAGIGVLLLAGPRRVTLASVAALGLGASALLVVYAGASSGLVNGLSNDATARNGDELLFLILAAMAIIAIVAFQRDRWLAGLHLPVLGTRRVVTAFVIVGVLGALLADPVTRLRALDATPAQTQLSAKQERTRFATVGGSGRVQFWESAIDAIKAEPLRGIGAGGFEYWWNLDRDLDLPVTHAHSLFLESAAELGIGGAVLALIFFAAPALGGVRRRLAPTAWADPDAARGAIGAALAVLAAGLLTAAIEWTWDIPATFVPVVIAAALLAVPPARELAAGPGRRPRWRRVSFFFVFAILALGSTAAAGVLFLSEESLEESRSLTAAGKPRRALAAAREANDWTPFHARPYEQIAIAERQLGNLGAAGKAIDEAEERANLDWGLWWIEAGIEFQASQTGEAIYALNHAQALNPKAPTKLFAAPSAIEVSFYRSLARRLGTAPGAGSDTGSAP